MSAARGDDRRAGEGHFETQAATWWHAYGQVREDMGGVWQLVVIGPATADDEDARAINHPAWGRPPLPRAQRHRGGLVSFAVYPQPDACRAWMPTTPMPPGASPPSPPMVCHMPKGHDGQHSNERRPSTLSRRWEGDASPPVRDPAPPLIVAGREPVPGDVVRFESVDYPDDSYTDVYLPRGDHDPQPWVSLTHDPGARYSDEDARADHLDGWRTTLLVDGSTGRAAS